MSTRASCMLPVICAFPVRFPLRSIWFFHGSVPRWIFNQEKKMKQESLGPLVISKPTRLTTIACRSRAPWLTSASDPALCQKILQCVPGLSLCHCPSPVPFFPKSSIQIPLCDLSAPSPTKKNPVLLCVDVDLHCERRGRHRGVLKVLHPLHALDRRHCPREEDKLKWRTSRLLSIEACSSSS